MPVRSEHPVYDALALPNEALDQGGVEILRAGIIDDALYVNARRAFKDAGKWGEVLADIARRLALLHAAEDTDLSEKEVLADIEEAFAAELGAPVVKDRSVKKPARKARPALRRKVRPKTAGKARKSARRRKRRA